MKKLKNTSASDLTSYYLSNWVPLHGECGVKSPKDICVCVCVEFLCYSMHM